MSTDTNETRPDTAPEVIAGPGYTYRPRERYLGAPPVYKRPELYTIQQAVKKYHFTFSTLRRLQKVGHFTEYKNDKGHYMIDGREIEYAIKLGQNTEKVTAKPKKKGKGRGKT